MMERRGRRIRRLRSGRLFRKDTSKKRTVSLDDTVTSLQSNLSCESQQLDSLGSRGQGALSKATATLRHRHLSPNCVNADNDTKPSAQRMLEDQKSSLSRPASNNTATKAHTEPMKSQDKDPVIRARQEAIRVQQRLLGKHHPDVLFSFESLARFHRGRGEYKEALLVLEEKQRLSKESYWNRSPRN